METILVPTDYSKASYNALEYAAMLAKQTNARLLLFHAFQIPVVASEAAVIAIPFEDLEKINNNKLKRLAEKFQKKHKDVPITYLTQAGFAIDIIKELTENKTADMVVMGIKEAGRVSELIVGSISSKITGTVRCPVVIVPEKGYAEKPSRIIFASDNGKPANSSGLRKLKNIIRVFKSRLALLTVVDDAAQEAGEKKKSAGVEKYFTGIKHSVNFIINHYDDVVEEINDFVKKNKANMVVMIAREHSFLNRLFNERKTKKMAFHTRIPLLVLSDRK